MRKILFVCHGNICRSPMAEYICKDLIDKNHLDVYCESRATSNEEIGNDIYPPAKKVLELRNIKYEKHHAKRITQKDVETKDEIYVMDSYNMSSINYIVDVDNKVKLLREFDIEDPWYTGNYNKVYDQIYEGVKTLLNIVD